MWNEVPVIVVPIALGIGLVSAVHALLNKRDPRSQLGWIVLCVTLPGLGAWFYWLLGVNRIKTRARRWAERGRWPTHGIDDLARRMVNASPARAANMAALLRLSRAVTRRPLLAGNRLEILHHGEEAYPAMLSAIAGARETICLSTYIFETNPVGRQFVDALKAAADRGVAVRVLIDAIGEKYSRPRARKLLRKRSKVEVARFLPLALSLRGLRVNLRNHRKILTVDKEIGFTGGMNIGGRHMVKDPRNPKPTQDVHFRLTGPAVAFLEEAFWGDWYFSTGNMPAWEGFRPDEGAGTALCRGIIDGPNEDFERLQLILVGAISCARERIRIMTPYFVPNRELLSALNSAALRGVEVEIVLPSKNNLPFVAWAANAMLWEVLQHGVKVYFRPAPFAHSKLFIVDDYYVLLGSANLDARSLRLNFELNVEVFDSDLGEKLARHFEEVVAGSRMTTLEEMDARSFLTRLRDSSAKLFSPFL